MPSLHCVVEIVLITCDRSVRLTDMARYKRPVYYFCTTGSLFDFCISWSYHTIAHVQIYVIIRDAVIVLFQFSFYRDLLMNNLTSIHWNAFITATELKTM